MSRDIGERKREGGESGNQEVNGEEEEEEEEEETEDKFPDVERAGRQFLSTAVRYFDESPSRTEIDVLSRGSCPDISRLLSSLKLYPISDNSAGSPGRGSLLPSLR